MMDSKRLDDLAQRLSGSLPKGLQALQDDIGRNVRAALTDGLSKLDLVTREEFDIQTAVLARTRQKLEELQELVAALERRNGIGEEATERAGGEPTGDTPTKP